MLSWGLDQIVIVYVPRASDKKNLESSLPIILVLRHIFLDFGHFEPIQALFEPPFPRPGLCLAGGWVKLSLYMSLTACTKQNLESILPIILVLGHILLDFGHF